MKHTMMKRISRKAIAIVLLMSATCLYGKAKNDTTVVRINGSFERSDYYRPRYSPVMIPKNTVKLIVDQSFSTPDGRKCNIDLGIFDGDGYGFNNSEGFRGWSGGARRHFEISEAYATPGYLPGKIESGEWNIVQMLVADVPLVDWTLEVTVITGRPEGEKFTPCYAAESVNKTPGWYRIDMHVHTEHSDGKNTPVEVVEAAKEAGLDGIVSTDHNTTSSLSHWGKVPAEDFLVINGMEVTYAEGHWNIINISPDNWVDFRFRRNDRERYAEAISKARKDDVILVANHPYNGTFRHDKSAMDCIEVWNGPWDRTDAEAVSVWQDMLESGVYKVAVGGSDYHRPGNVIGLPHTVIKSDGLSRNEIMKGIRGAGCYIAADSGISVTFEVTGNDGNKAGIGESIYAENPVISFSSNYSGVLKLYSDKGLFFNGKADAGETVNVKAVNGTGWVRAELYAADGSMKALTNPIFILPFNEDSLFAQP